MVQLKINISKINQSVADEIIDFVTSRVCAEIELKYFKSPKIDMFGSVVKLDKPDNEMLTLLRSIAERLANHNTDR